MNDLAQVEMSELFMQQQARALAVLFTALDACKDIVHVTDTNHRIQVRSIQPVFPIETILDFFNTAKDRFG